MSVSDKPARTYRCARCNVELPQYRKWVYSKHTGKRYCVDYDECERRAKKAKT